MRIKTFIRRRRLLVLLALAVLALAAPSGAALASPTVRLSIWHVVAHCHVWGTDNKQFGAQKTITLKRGTRLEIRPNCPMDFDFTQTKGPKLNLGNKRTYAGTVRAIVFRKAGTYHLRAKNVQSPEERGLDTTGPTNVLTLTIVVK